MRVTQGMISNNMLHHLTRSYGKLDKHLNQLNTGRKINRPSDDPFITIKGHSYRTQVKEIEQYKRNLGEVYSWMDNTDEALDSGLKTMHRIRELATQASTDTYSKEERQNIKSEIEQLKQELKEIANTKVNGKYIFNGADTKNPPIGDDFGINFIGEEHKDFNIELGNGLRLDVNVYGEDIFGEELLGDDGVLDQFISALEENDQEAINESLGALDERIDEFVNARADLGARMNRVDLIADRVDAQEITATDMMSKNENVDYEKAIMDLITQETMHRAALSAGTRVMQPTLMDFLR